MQYPKITNLQVTLSYDGTDFFGWAKQPDLRQSNLKTGRGEVPLRTVQGEIESAMTKVFGILTPPKFIVGGRTDTGVHANGQVINFPLDQNQQKKIIGSTFRTLESGILSRFNGTLPLDIRFLSVKTVPLEFNSRFSAQSRTYQYQIVDNLGIKSSLISRYAAFIDGELDLELMNQVANQFLGLHDFSTFVKSRPTSSNIRNLMHFSFQRSKKITEFKKITATLTADAFAHNMVRSLLSALIYIGLHKREPQWLLNHFQNRTRVSETGPIEAKGLILQKISYPTSGSAIKLQNLQTKHRRTPSELQK